MAVSLWTNDLHRYLAKCGDLIPGGVKKDVLRLCSIVEALPNYEYREPAFQDMEEAVTESSDLMDLAHLIGASAKAFGLDYATVFLIHPGRAVSFSKRICTSLPQEWIDRYIRKNYQYVDPTFLHAYACEEAFLFSSLPRNCPMVADFWVDAVKYGIGQEGYCLVYNFGGGMKVGLNMMGDRAHADVAQSFEENFWDLHAFGRAVCHSFISHAATFEAKNPRLSDDELRLLKQLINISDCRTLKEIQEERRYDQLRQAICRKLGVATIYQAILVASRQGWLHELPVEASEVATLRHGQLGEEGMRSPGCQKGIFEAVRKWMPWGDRLGSSIPF